MNATDIKSDIKANMAELHGIGADPEKIEEIAPRLLAHLKDTLWPFLDGLADVLVAQEEAVLEQADLMEELEEVVDEMTDRQGDLLTPQTAGVFATVILLGAQMANAAERGERISPDLIGQFRIAAEAAETVIKQITVQPPDDDEEDEADNDNDDEEDDDGDE